MAKGKIYDSFAQVVADIPSGATIMIGAFGVAADVPSNLVLALRDLGVNNLTIISNCAGLGELSKITTPPDGYPDIGILFENRQVKKFIGSVPALGGMPPTSPFEKQYRAGEVELELVPQGTLAERIRAAGGGIGGFYTPTGVGTIIERGKEKRIINGREYILELPLKADFSLIRAYKADTVGNLIYRGIMRSFNPVMATAAEITIAEVDEIAQPGELEPNVITTPGIYVDRIVKGPHPWGTYK